MSKLTDWCSKCEYRDKDKEKCEGCVIVYMDGEEYAPCNYSGFKVTPKDWHEAWCNECDQDDVANCDRCYFDYDACCPTMFVVDRTNDPFISNDQTIKADAGKPKLTLVPRQILYSIARVREYGNAKYPEGGADNWRSVEPKRYRDALFRHLLLYLDDPYGVDEESGLKHLDHIACNVAFLCELEKEKK